LLERSTSVSTPAEEAALVQGYSPGVGMRLVLPRAPELGVPQVARVEPAYYQLPDDGGTWHGLSSGGTVEVLARASDDSAISLAFTGEWCTGPTWDVAEPSSCSPEETRIVHLESADDEPAVVDVPPQVWGYPSTDHDDGSGLCGVGELLADTGP
jgi:hypothetical protein